VALSRPGDRGPGERQRNAEPQRVDCVRIVHFARNALAHAARNGRRVVAAFIATGVPGPPKAGLGWATGVPGPPKAGRGWATAFAQNDAEAASSQGRKGADHRSRRDRSADPAQARHPDG
jgi:hypothetical protein